MAERIVLSLAQVSLFRSFLDGTGFERIVIENTNIDDTVAVQLDGKWTLVSASGHVYKVPENG